MNEDHKAIIEKLWRAVKVADAEGALVGDQWSHEPGRFYRSQLPQVTTNGEGRIPAIDAWVGRFNVEVGLAPDGQAPSLSPSKNLISLPPLRDFKSAPLYYSTLFHELIHWTGMKLRRPTFMNSKNGDARVCEEIVAETGAAILNDYWGLGSVDESASYVRYFVDQIPPYLQPKGFDLCSKVASIAVDYLMKA